MRRRWLLWTLLACCGSAGAQQADTLPARVAAMLRRAENGHSPTPEEIAAVETVTPAPAPAEVTAALPAVRTALANPDVAVRTWALTLLAGLETPTANPTGTAAAGFSADVAQALEPAVPAIATSLTEEQPALRLLAASVLGGFHPAPASVYPPLLAYLKREDAPGAVGLAVVVDLLAAGPVQPETAAAVTRFLRRPDQDTGGRADLVDTIASAPNQGAALNKALLGLLSSGDAGLRSRVVLSLPQLDLTPEDYAQARERVSQMAVNPGESLQVQTAAKSVAGCWTAVHMTSGCPVY